MKSNKEDTGELVNKPESVSKSWKPNWWLQKQNIVGRDKMGVLDWHIQYILLYKEWMNSKDLLSSTEKSTQYSVVTYMGKESEKEWIYACNKYLSVYIYIDIYI